MSNRASKKAADRQQREVKTTQLCISTGPLGAKKIARAGNMIDGGKDNKSTDVSDRFLSLLLHLQEYYTIATFVATFLTVRTVIIAYKQNR